MRVLSKLFYKDSYTVHSSVFSRKILCLPIKFIITKTDKIYIKCKMCVCPLDKAANQLTFRKSFTKISIGFWFLFCFRRPFKLCLQTFYLFPKYVIIQDWYKWLEIYHIGKNNVKRKEIECTGRETNPGLPRGRREFYHWTTSASYKNSIIF